MSEAECEAGIRAWLDVDDCARLKVLRLRTELRQNLNMRDERYECRSYHAAGAADLAARAIR